jgi:pyroglutamyl-peptidase
MTTLLTGFNRFGDLEVNPTQLIVEQMAKRPRAFANVNLVAEVLPTEFIEAGNRISQLIRQHRPETVVCLGVGAGLKEIHLERVALNFDDGGMPDNAGVSRTGQRIVPDGPLAYQSTLPLVEMREALIQRGIPAIISDDAGTYVCNHVFYLARHEVECLGIGSLCGFIHVPQMSEHTAVGALPMFGLALDLMIEAVECCLKVTSISPATAGIHTKT